MRNLFFSLFLIGLTLSPASGLSAGDFYCVQFFESASRGNLEEPENIRFHLRRLGYDAEALLPQAKGIPPQIMKKKQMINAYDLAHGFSATGWRRFEFLEKSAEEESRRRVEVDFLTRDLYPALSRQWTGTPKSPLKEFWKARFEYAFVAAIDVLTFKMNSLLYMYPYHSPSWLWKIKSNIFNYYQTHDWDSTYQRYRTELKILGITDVAWRKGRQIYAVFIAGLLIHYSSAFMNYVPMLTSLHQVNPKALAKYEQETYNSEAIIQDQYKNWLESLDNTPTDAEKKAQLEKIRRFEARGVFRIYNKPTDGPHPP